MDNYRHESDNLSQLNLQSKSLDLLSLRASLPPQLRSLDGLDGGDIREAEELHDCMSGILCVSP